MKTQKTRQPFWILVLLSLSLLMGCSSTHQPRTIEILAVNDIHAAIDRFPQFAALVDRLRGSYPNLLLVSGGDNQTGNPANDQYPEKGLPVIELMNAVKFDLSAVGNHEFDSKPANFEKLTHQADFDFLSANTIQPTDGNFRINPYKIVETANGLKVAFVSLLAINAKGIPDTHPDHVKGFAFKDPFQTAQEYLFLRDQSDVLIMLNHMGFEQDVKIAMQLPSNAVDVIIGGHSHTKVEKEQIHNGVLITQAGHRLNYATLIKLTVNPDGKIDKQMELLSIDKTGSARADIQEMVNTYQHNPVLTETIATATDNFSSTEEIGYLITDAMRAMTDSNIALVNAGGVRVSTLARGPIRTKDVYEIDPFGNEVIRFMLSGHEIRDLFLAAFASSKYKLIYPSGMMVRYLLNADQSLKDVTLLTSEHKALNMDKRYSVVMSDYMASVYSYKHQDPGQRLFRPTAETAIDYLKKMKTIPSYQGLKRIEVSQ